jgi:hypothetical protein
MTRRVLRAGAAGVVLATLLLFATLAFQPVDSAVALDGYVLLLGGVALLALVRVTVEPDPDARRSPYEQALEAVDESPERPPELARVEREVALGIANSFYEHYRLRPLLREIASQRLESRHGVELDAPRADARELLPEHAWELLDTERRPPRDRHAPGMPVDQLRAIVDALERLGEGR